MNFNMFVHRNSDDLINMLLSDFKTGDKLNYLKKNCLNYFLKTRFLPKGY